MAEKIDFVIAWVDGSDPAWLEEKNKYSLNTKNDARDIRFRDFNLLKYWFRAVEKNAPWVNKIYFVTWGHLPKWLNTEHKKIRVINHKDYIPSKYLPTFSSHTIELNFHRIKDLSEHFVYFNDDMYLLDRVKPEDFFVDGLPCDCLVENPITPLFGGFSPILNEMGCVINKHFTKADLKKLGFKKYMNPIYKELLIRTVCMGKFTHIMGFYNHHLAQPHLKSTFEEVWSKEYDELDKTCSSRFRGLNEVNQWLFKHWNLCTGKFHPQYPLGKNIKMSQDMKYLSGVILNAKYKTITINDVDGLSDIDKRQEILIRSFQKRFPKKCSYEK